MSYFVFLSDLKETNKILYLSLMDLSMSQL